MIEERASTHVYHQQQMLSHEDLLSRENLCVHEQPAYCVAACPLKLDTKGMVAAIAREDWGKALSLYEKITPFPHLLSGGCEAPCENACKLSTLKGGEGIAVSKLEQAVVTYGEKSASRRLPRMKKKQTIGILGSGLFLLFLAGELQKKAYPITILCEEKDLSDYLAGAASYASRDTLEKSLSILKGMDLTFQFSSQFSSLEEYMSSYDILCADYRLATSLWGEIHPDPALSYCRDSRLVTAQTTGVLDAAFAAKKGALTVDRLAQKLDPSNTRGEEGSCMTTLYTDLTEVKASARVLSGDALSKELAVKEANRCIQCQCDACIKGCAYLSHYHKYPKKLTREIYNNVSIIMGDHMMNKPINSCALCGQCAVVCPNGYDMSEVCHMARENMVATGKMPLAPHEFALNDMIFSNTEGFLARSQPGFSTCRYIFFPGCQACAIAPNTVYAAYEDLCHRLDGGVALLLGCCGAISDWAGRTTLYQDTCRFLDDQLEALGNPVVIAGCPTCMKELTGHEQLTLAGIWDILADIGLPSHTDHRETVYAVHDSCGARGNPHIQQTIRRLAEDMGCTLVDTPYSGDRSPCCGYGGLAAYANPEVAKEMTQQCLTRSQEPFLTYCMACRDRFAREGNSSKHLLELIYGTDAGTPPDISEKRYHRLHLKNRLLLEVWKEELPEMKLDYEITYTQEALAMMNERMILKSDVIQVLDALRETGNAILDSDTGLCSTCLRIGNVTFWVKYTEEEDGFCVHSAYSHRMNIVRR